MFDKTNVGEIHKEITAALEAVAKKHNLTLAPSRISYGDSTFSFKAEFGSNEATGGADPILFNDTKKYGHYFNLDVTDIGKELVLGARTYRIEGMKGRNVIGKLVSADKKMGGLFKLRGEDVMAVYKKA